VPSKGTLGHVDMTEGKTPGKDGVCISIMTLSPILLNFVRVNPGDAIVFYNYESHQTGPSRRGAACMLPYRYSKKSGLLHRG
jgi:hypothetical protein